MGVYTCVGTKTCKRNRPGSYGHFDIDAATFAGWGLDFVKADFCHRPSNESAYQLYSNFSHYLNATGRPMIFSLCNWGEQNVTEWGSEVGQMYRIQMDHLPFWHTPKWAAGVGYGSGTGDIIRYVGDLNLSTITR